MDELAKYKEDFILEIRENISNLPDSKSLDFLEGNVGFLHDLVTKNSSHFKDYFLPTLRAKAFSFLHRHYKKTPEHRFTDEDLIAAYRELFDSTEDFETELFILLELLSKGLILKEEDDGLLINFFVSKINDPLKIPSLQVFSAFVNFINIKKNSHKNSPNLVQLTARSPINEQIKDLLQSNFPLPPIYEMPVLIGKIMTLKLPETKAFLITLLDAWEANVVTEKEEFNSKRKTPLESFPRQAMIEQLVFPIRTILERDDFESRKTYWTEKVQKLNQAWIVLVYLLFFDRYSLLDVKEKNAFHSLATSSPETSKNDSLLAKVLRWEKNDLFKLAKPIQEVLATTRKGFRTDSRANKLLNNVITAYANPSNLLGDNLSDRISEKNRKILQNLILPLAHLLSLKYQLASTNHKNQIRSVGETSVDYPDQSLANIINIWLVFLDLQRELLTFINIGNEEFLKSV